MSNAVAVQRTAAQFGLFSTEVQLIPIRKRSVSLVRPRSQAQPLTALNYQEDRSDTLDMFEEELRWILRGFSADPFKLNHEQILFIHEVLLSSSLHSLRDQRCSVATQIETWQWVNAPMNPDPKKAKAFTFQACCAACCTDPDLLIDALQSSTRGMPFRDIVDNPFLTAFMAVAMTADDPRQLLRSFK